MLGLKLILIRKRGPWTSTPEHSLVTSFKTNLIPFENNLFVIAPIPYSSRFLMRRAYWTDIFFRNMSHLINPHPVIRGLSGAGMHKDCHYLKISLNLFLGFHVILKNVARYHSGMFLYSVVELRNNYFEFNENCTYTANRASGARVLLKSSLIKIYIHEALKKLARHSSAVL